MYSSGQTYDRSKYFIDNSVGQYTLMIKYVTSAEAGNYTCIDDAGSVLATYSLTVTGNIKQVTFFPLQSIEIANSVYSVC